MKTSTIVIGVAAVGGYYWWQEQKKKAAIKTIAQAPGQASSFFSSVAKGITGAISSFFPPETVTLSQPTVQNVLPGTKPASAPPEPFVWDGKVGTAVLEGYHGSLGGGLRALRGGKYGSLG